MTVLSGLWRVIVISITIACVALFVTYERGVSLQRSEAIFLVSVLLIGWLLVAAYIGHALYVRRRWLGRTFASMALCFAMLVILSFFNEAHQATWTVQPLDMIGIIGIFSGPMGIIVRLLFFDSR